MNRFLFTCALTMAWASAASAALINGTFDDGLNGWTKTGSVVKTYSAGDINCPPASPSGLPVAGAITGYGGDPSKPMGSLTQTVDFTGSGFVRGEWLAAALSTRPTQDVGIEVLWNDTVVASLWKDATTDAASTLAWEKFKAPIVGVGENTLKIQFTHHYATKSWTTVDNLSVVPEPTTMALLAGGLITLIRRRRA